MSKVDDIAILRNMASSPPVEGRDFVKIPKAELRDRLDSTIDAIQEKLGQIPTLVASARVLIEELRMIE